MIATYERELGRSELGATIPKILHQTFATRDLPAALRANVEELRRLNPDWDHRLYDDAMIETFIAEEYGDGILAAYRRIDPRYGAARADLFRYLLVYRVGGVYLDIKSSFAGPISGVIKGDESFIVSRWSNGKGERYEGYGLKPEVAQYPGGELQQWHVIAAPGHPFLRAVLLAILRGIDSYRPWADGTGKLGVLKLTGPIMYTHAITPIIDDHPRVIVANEAAIGLNYSVVAVDAHKDFFKRHYSSSDAPVIQPSPALKPLYSAYRAVRALKKMVRA